MIKRILAATAICMAGIMAGPAIAAPVGSGAMKAAEGLDTSATKVHYRRYRHCHRRYGRRRCHGRRSYYRGYDWWLPGVGIYFGKKHHHHRRRHRRRH